MTRDLLSVNPKGCGGAAASNANITKRNNDHIPLSRFTDYRHKFSSSDYILITMTMSSLRSTVD